MLGEQENLLARVEQPADTKNGIILADVRIEKNGIASGINYRCMARTRVSGEKAVEHACRRHDHRVGRGYATHDGVAIPLQPACGTRGAALDGLSPGDEVPVRHDHAWNIDGEIGVAELVQVKQVRL